MDLKLYLSLSPDVPKPIAKESCPVPRVSIEDRIEFALTQVENDTDLKQDAICFLQCLYKELMAIQNKSKVIQKRIDFIRPVIACYGQLMPKSHSERET